MPACPSIGIAGGNLTLVPGLLGRPTLQEPCPFQVVVLEGALHPADFARTGIEARGDLAPGRCDGGHFLYDRLRLRRTETEELRGRYDEAEVACSLVQVDVGGQDALAHIDRRRIEVVGRRQGPAAAPGPEEAMIAQMVVDVRDQDVEDHP